MRNTLIVCGLALALAGSVLAGTVTLDMNGFANLTGGQVTGTGLEKAIPLPAKEGQVKLEGLQAGGTYQVDFFHNAGEGSSDFTFTMNAEGTGVAEVAKGGGKYDMLDGFTPGQATLKLKTFPINYNANGGQTGVYFIQGLVEAYKLEAGKGAQPLTAIPGCYSVDNLYNTGGGNEDFAFTVDSEGKVSGCESIYIIGKDEERKRNADEYAEFKDSAVNPRTAKVHFLIEGSGNVNFHGTHRVGEITGTAPVYEFDMPMTVGSGGLNLWSFGAWEVTGGDAVLFDGKPATGTKGENDYHFYPVLRYDLEKKAFHFETLHGPDTTVIGEAKGTYDGGDTPLSVKVTATIVPEPNDEEKAEEPVE
ncbi:MAG: hypothetical protein ACYC6A_16265 [Armatimonadota bacterium]